MSSVIDQLIIEGKHLFERVCLHYETTLENIPIEERVTVAELESWYRGAAGLLETTYGPQSREMNIWRQRREEAQKRGWDKALQGSRPGSENFVVDLLADAIGALAEIKVMSTGAQPVSADGLPLTALHTIVVERCSRLFAPGTYDFAVFAAFKAVEEEVRRLSGADSTDIGVSLVSKAMGGNAPLILLSTIAAEQEAFHALFRGAIGALKNPLSHRTVEHSDPVRVLELLAFASLLLRVLQDFERKRSA